MCNKDNFCLAAFVLQLFRTIFERITDEIGGKISQKCADNLYLKTSKYRSIAYFAIYILTTMALINMQYPPPLSRLGTGLTLVANEVSRRSYLRTEQTASYHLILDL